MRYRDLLLAVFILCLSLAMATLAGAQGTATSPSTPDTSTQASPGTQPTPSPAPSTNDSAPQSTPGAQTSSPSSSPSGNQGTPSAGSTNSGQSGSNASGSNSVEDELQLSPDQKQKIATIVDDENKQIGTVRNDSSLSTEQKQQKVMQIRQEGSPKIKAILTPEQLQKLTLIQQRMKEQQQGGAGTNASPNGTQSAPQSNSPQSAPPQK